MNHEFTSIEERNEIKEEKQRRLFKLIYKKWWRYEKIWLTHPFFTTKQTEMRQHSKNKYVANLNHFRFSFIKHPIFQSVVSYANNILTPQVFKAFHIRHHFKFLTHTHVVVCRRAKQIFSREIITFFNIYTYSQTYLLLRKVDKNVEQLLGYTT